MNIIKILTLNNLFRYKLILIAVVITAVILTACNNKVIDPPPDEEPLPKLTIINEDVSCTEVWLKIKVDSLNTPSDIKLYRDSSLILNLSASGGLNLDTLYYEENLLPNRSYVYKLILTYNNKEYTESVNVTTLNITSSNFTWETIEFGQHSSSVLYDVAIVGEQIWAVGEIYMNDAQGNPDPKLYNAVHWDGEKWELKRIKTNACGGVDYPPVKAIFVFSSSDILFAHIDGSISKYNGIIFSNDCTLITQLNGSANKIWGKSNNDFYVVSGNGFIAHYSGSSWRKIESGTELDINDIWGYSKGLDNYILMPYSNRGTNLGKGLIQIKNGEVSHIDWQPQKTAMSVWTKNGNKIYVAGDGLYTQTNKLWKNETPINYFTTIIRGTEYNNIFLGGVFSYLGYYNGISWNRIEEVNFNTGTYEAISFKDNKVAVTGFSRGKGIIAIGSKQ